MTKFEAIQKQYQAALWRFEEILRQERTDIVRDAALKRFEFTFDLAWKTMKAFLEEQKGIVCRSPKDCIRLAYQEGLIAYNELWLQMTDWRNRIVHEYSEEYAAELYEKMSGVLKLFQELNSALKKEPA